MDSVSWANGRGVISCDLGSMLFSEKPDLSFEFDALYYEETLMKKVIDDVDHALSPEEITEIEAWIEAQLELPLLINGVDAEGNYLEGVPESAVVKTVNMPPPSQTGWRYDFEASAAGGDHWVQTQ
jgi:hypothetical protein